MKETEGDDPWCGVVLVGEEAWYRVGKMLWPHIEPFLGGSCRKKGICRNERFKRLFLVPVLIEICSNLILLKKKVANVA